MKLFLIERTDDAQYDEYDAFVIRAENEENALKLCNDKKFDYQHTEIIELLAEGEEDVILGSFNAGY